MASLYYHIDQELKVTLTPCPSSTASETHDSPSAPAFPTIQTLTFRVVRVYSPSTFSAVLEVKLVTSERATGDPESAADDNGGIALDPEATYILKLFDRRCIESLRKFPHNADIETQYRRYLDRPDRTPIAYTWSGPDPEDDGYNETDHPAVHEGWIDWYCAGIHQKEVPIYRRLMQDPDKYALFPRFFGTVEVETEIGSVHGLLLEHISPAITLTQFVREGAPCGKMSDKVEKICQEAMNAMGRLTDEYILNDDIRSDNILVRLSEEWPSNDPSTCLSDIAALGCVFIDFGQARLRFEDEADFEWTQAKCWTDQAGRLISDCHTMFEEAGGQECPHHGTDCRTKTSDSRADSSSSTVERVGPLGLRLPVVEDCPWREELTDEERDLWEAFPCWGLYEHRPHPRTVEEARARMEQMLAEADGDAKEERAQLDQMFAELDVGVKDTSDTASSA